MLLPNNILHTKGAQFKDGGGPNWLFEASDISENLKSNATKHEGSYDGQGPALFQMNPGSLHARSISCLIKPAILFFI